MEKAVVRAKRMLQQDQHEPLTPVFLVNKTDLPNSSTEPNIDLAERTSTCRSPAKNITLLIALLPIFGGLRTVLDPHKIAQESTKPEDGE